MADDQTVAHVLATILHHAGTTDANPATLGNIASQSGIGASSSGMVAATNAEGGQAIAAATQPSGATTTADTTAADTATIPAGSDAVGLNNPTVSEGYGVNGHPGI